MQISNTEDFLRRFRTKGRVLSLTDQEVSALKQTAAQGDAYAQYGYGRWLYYHIPNDDALHDAEDLFIAAKDTVPDALAAYALMWRYGETRENVMDLERSNELMDGAVSRGSELAELKVASFSIFGSFCEADPEGVSKMIEQRIADSTAYDPSWLTQLAYAYQELNRMEDAIRCLENAIELGETDTYADLAELYYQRGNIALYESLMEEGIEKGCPMCMLYQADIDEEFYEELCPEEQRQLHDDVEERLCRGLQLGEGLCAYFLYILHYNGNLGFTADRARAFAYLKMGVRLGNADCMNELALEAQSCGVPGLSLTETEKAELWLRAARYAPHNEDVLHHLMHVSSPAFLLQHKEELERYWKPLYDKQNSLNDHHNSNNRKDNDAAYTQIDSLNDDPTEENDDDGRWDAWV